MLGQPEFSFKTFAYTLYQLKDKDKIIIMHLFKGVSPQCSGKLTGVNYTIYNSY